MTAELFESLLKAENGIADRLAKIEGQLEELLEQTYYVAIDAGLRTLVDAGTAPSRSLRDAELIRAQERFRTAVAAARSPLQSALAERYGLLCAVALGRLDTARNSIGPLSIAAFNAAIVANNAVERRTMIDTPKLRGAGRRESDLIRSAACDAADLAVNLLREAEIWSSVVNPQAITWRLRGRWPAHEWNYSMRPGSSTPSWEIELRGRTPVLTFGPVTIAWNIGLGELSTASKIPVSAPEQVNLDISIDPPAKIELHLSCHSSSRSRWRTINIAPARPVRVVRQGMMQVPVGIALPAGTTHVALNLSQDQPTHWYNLGLFLELGQAFRIFLPVDPAASIDWPEIPPQFESFWRQLGFVQYPKLRPGV